MTAPLSTTVSADRSPCPIMAMHTRFEQASAEYRVVERAEREARDRNDDAEAGAYQRALKSLVGETEALRLAILHQVPDDWPAAMVLQFHIVGAFDVQANCDDVPAQELAALQTAIETLFDFLCCEVEQDHGAMGSAFQSEANRTFFKRRYRTGVVED